MQDLRKTTGFHVKKESFTDHNLIIIDGQQSVRSVELKKFNKSKITFGVQEDSDIRLNSPIVSRKHGIIEILNGKCYIYDTNSLNGIFLQGKKIQASNENDLHAVELQEGMSIRIDSENLAYPHSNGVVMIYSTYPIEAESEWKKINLSKKKKLTIGRDMTCDLRIPHQSVSRIHAEIYASGQEWYICDNHSTNGIIINGVISDTIHELREKDVICIANSKIIYTSGMIIYNANSSGASLKITGLRRTVTENRKSKKILDNVTLDIKPREFIAIIGGSGAGKSTFMNAICGFEKADRGSVLFNGLDLYSNFHTLKSIIGYVPQQDSIYDGLSVRRMLKYSAKMRMPDDSTDEEITQTIDNVLKILDLHREQDTLIRKLSGGQKKRTSIAVELLANPNLFFLDEPTSGLDPGIEQNLMQTLRTLSHEQGKTIIMVTHTIQNIELCDKVIVMGRGGRLCYYGKPQEMKDFFGVKNITSVYNLISERSNEWKNKFDSLRTGTESEKNSESPLLPSPIHSQTHPQNKKAISFFRQFTALYCRYAEIIKKDIRQIFVMLAQPIIIALLIMLVASNNIFSIYEDTNSILFTISCACIWIGLFNSIQEVCKERTIIRREYLVNLNLGAYVLSKITIQFFIACVQGILFTIVCSLTIGLPNSGFYFTNAFGEILATIILTIIASSSMGLLISSLSKTSSQAMLATPFILMFHTISH